MAIFARRTLQRFIDNNASFMTAAQLAKLVKGLNRAGEQSLDTEWEAAVLYALSLLGPVVHEPILGGTSRIDVQFGAGLQTQFVADIATVSSRGLERANPLRGFRQELTRRLKRAGFSGSGFNLRVEGRDEGNERHRVHRLLLPQKSDFPQVFDSSFAAFLNDCLANPTTRRSFTKKVGNSIDLTIGFIPGQQGFVMSHPSYEVAYSLDNNPVRNVLSRKAVQLGKARWPGAKGIILCEADYNLRRMTGGYSPDKIVMDFLRQKSSVAFVLILAAVVDPQVTRLGLADDTRVYSKLILNSTAEVQLERQATEILQRVANQLPRPINNGVNALYQLSGQSPQGRSFIGGFQVSGNSVRISARTLLAVLAGQLDQPPQITELFRRKMAQHMTINAAQVEAQADQDDDWITFHFREYDPAIAPLKAPPSTTPPSSLP
jgi:hypothetical protein